MHFLYKMLELFILLKTLGTEWAINLGITFDLTRLSPKNKTALNNTMYYISPSVLYKSSNINAQIGIRPSWDNKSFKMFPNVLADINTEDRRFTFQAGWTGYIRKTTYMYLAGENPWLFIPDQLKNTWIEERFAGFKGSVGDHFTYAAKVGFNKLNNQPLFVNDTLTALGGKSFRVVNESKMNVVNFGGELGFNIHEKFSIITGVTFNQFSGLQDNAKAYGLIPLELKAARLIGDKYPPAMCYYSSIKNTGGKCRVCLVKVTQGSEANPRPMPKLVASCLTKVEHGMVVENEASKEVIDARNGIVEFLLINHPLDCPICDQAGECDLQNLSFENGKGETRYEEERRKFEKLFWWKY